MFQISEEKQFDINVIPPCGTRKPNDRSGKIYKIQRKYDHIPPNIHSFRNAIDDNCRSNYLPFIQRNLPFIQRKQPPTGSSVMRALFSGKHVDTCTAPCSDRCDPQLTKTAECLSHIRSSPSGIGEVGLRQSMCPGTGEDKIQATQLQSNGKTEYINLHLLGHLNDVAVEKLTFGPDGNPETLCCLKRNTVSFPGKQDVCCLPKKTRWCPQPPPATCDAHSSCRREMCDKTAKTENWSKHIILVRYCLGAFLYWLFISFGFLLVFVFVIWIINCSYMGSFLVISCTIFLCYLLVFRCDSIFELPWLDRWPISCVQLYELLLCPKIQCEQQPFTRCMRDASDLDPAHHTRPHKHHKTLQHQNPPEPQIPSKTDRNRQRQRTVEERDREEYEGQPLTSPNQSVSQGRAGRGVVKIAIDLPNMKDTNLFLLLSRMSVSLHILRSIVIPLVLD